MPIVIDNKPINKPIQIVDIVKEIGIQIYKNKEQINGIENIENEILYKIQFYDEVIYFVIKR